VNPIRQYQHAQLGRNNVGQLVQALTSVICPRGRWIIEEKANGQGHSIRGNDDLEQAYLISV